MCVLHPGNPGVFLVRQIGTVAADLRRAIRATPLVPYEDLAYPGYVGSDGAAVLKGLLTTGWTKNGSLILDFKQPLMFDRANRSHSFDLHAWQPLEPILRHYDDGDATEVLDCVVGYATTWLDRYLAMHPKGPGVTMATGDTLASLPEQLAWIDIAVGRRIARLAYIVDRLARARDDADDVLLRLWDAIAIHHDVLSEDSHFCAHNNHGFFQVLGQLVAGRRFAHVTDTSAIRARCLERLAGMLERHFTPSGVHKEHSPGYHFNVMTTLVAARKSRLLPMNFASDQIVAMQQALEWMLLPDRAPVPFGDTDLIAAPKNPLFASWLDVPALKHWFDPADAVSIKPQTGLKCFNDAGYIFYRKLADEALSQDSYFAQMAGFHSRIHKHADHLSFVWYDRGRIILTDPGRMEYLGRTQSGDGLYEEGFWYADPKRIYVESTRAHNTVEVDGRSQMRKARSPFGSAIISARHDDDLVVTKCSFVEPSNVRHTRTIVYKTGHFLVVADWLFDRTDKLHDFRQWFNFGQGWQGWIERGQLVAAHPGNSALARIDIRAQSVLPEPQMGQIMQGQVEPQLQGWIARSPTDLVPAMSVALERSGVSEACFVTVFVVGDHLAIQPTGIGFNRTLGSGRFSWADNKGRFQVTLEEKGTIARLSVL
jgi:Heparinase II/III-like protein/Heparinase II/III N-terminus